MPRMALTLAEALRTGRLPEFVAQQQAAGLPTANREAFEAVLRSAVKPVTAKGRTSRSRTGGDLTGSKTRRDISASSRR